FKTFWGQIAETPKKNRLLQLRRFEPSHPAGASVIPGSFPSQPPGSKRASRQSTGDQEQGNNTEAEKTRRNATLQGDSSPYDFG
ncbi:MAG: hypothetical protein KDA80_01730, partial [Planctomycetaceae bacterium]|nr:hypothetical protein [Planctomycetaceae bacterium]